MNKSVLALLVAVVAISVLDCVHGFAGFGGVSGLGLGLGKNIIGVPVFLSKGKSLLIQNHVI